MIREWELDEILIVIAFMLRHKNPDIVADRLSGVLDGNKKTILNRTKGAIQKKAEQYKPYHIFKELKNIKPPYPFTTGYHS